MRVDNSSYTAEIILVLRQGDKYRVKGVDIVGFFESLQKRIGLWVSPKFKSWTDYWV